MEIVQWPGLLGKPTQANIYWKGIFENRGAFNPIGGGGGAKKAPPILFYLS